MERLEDRLLPAGGPLPNDWFAQHLQDSGVCSLALSDYQRDGSLTRTDIIGLFQEVSADGIVRAKELHDLRTIIRNSALFGMAPDVLNLAGKVIRFDRANESFQGQPLLPMGQLTAGSKGQVLDDLVAKWFLGEDHPALTHDAVAAGWNYQYAQGTLFAAGGPTIQDIDQGVLGDCFFPAALGAVTARDPAAIENMFIDNGDGTFSVRFFRQYAGEPQAQWVTVDRFLPVDNGGFLVYAGNSQSSSEPNEVLWLALAEKGYAQLAASGWSHAAKKINSYAALDEGGYAADVLQQVLGEKATSPNLRSESIFRSAVQQGDFVTLDSKMQEVKGSPVLADHAYFVTGFDSGTGTYIIVNPWGPNFDDGAGHPGTLQLTWAQIRDAFSYWDDAVAMASPLG